MPFHVNDGVEVVSPFIPQAIKPYSIKPQNSDNWSIRLMPASGEARAPSRYPGETTHFELTLYKNQVPATGESVSLSTKTCPAGLLGTANEFGAGGNTTGLNVPDCLVNNEDWIDVGSVTIPSSGTAIVPFTIPNVPLGTVVILRAIHVASGTRVESGFAVGQGQRGFMDSSTVVVGGIALAALALWAIG